MERIAERGSLPARQVKLPGVLVDAIVVATNPDHHTQNYKVAYNPAFSAELKVPSGPITTCYHHRCSSLSLSTKRLKITLWNLSY